MRRAALALAVLLSSGARADGAFPTGSSVLLPAGAPQRILVGTTFGLVISEDAGATWRYVCEPYVTAAGANVLVYQGAPTGELIAAHQDALSRSADVGCTWTPATGSVAGLLVVDAFIAPSNPSSVVAIGWPQAAGASLLPSNDGGQTFGPALLASGTAEVHADERLLSVEIAASASGVVYATTFAFPTASNPTGSAALLRSGDGGASWTRSALQLGPSVQARIAQVDPADPNTVYLLVSSAATDEIRVTVDGGATVQPLLAPNGPLSGFVRASDGSLYAGTPGGDFYLRAPGASGFQKLPGPHLRCLAERAGRVYACGDPAADGYDLASTDDGGKSFQKRLSFTQILGPLSCPSVQSACAADFAQLQRTLALVPASGNCSCGGSSGSGGVLLILLAAALRRRRRAPAPDPR
jgi:uncharacterized protein (TIGR03382 family)